MGNEFKYSNSEIVKIPYPSFFEHLRVKVLDSISLEILDLILEQSDVYIFSGIIRDYLLQNNKPVRDVDIVIAQDINWLSIIRKYYHLIRVPKKSFAGCRLNKKN